MNVLFIILIYFAIGYFIRLIVIKKLIKESFQLFSGIERIDSPDEMYEQVMRRVKSIEGNYELPPMMMYVFFWPIAVTILFFIFIFEYLSNFSSKIEEKMVSDEIKKYKKSNPQKFI